VRPLIGRAGWRLIHFLSFVIFGLVLLHGVQSGSDTGSIWAQFLYWLSGTSLLFLTIYRVLASVMQPTPTPRPAARPAPAGEPLARA
jgi:cytochrome b561